MGEDTGTKKENLTNGGVMKSFFNNIQGIIILILIIIIILLQTCNGNKKDCPDVEKQIEYVTDTVEISVEEKVYVPKWRTKVETKIETRVDTVEILVKENVDTVKILEDYYSKYFYIDTIPIDTIGFIIVNDTISRNSILSRKIKSNYTYPKITIIKKEYINRYEFYTGMTAKFNKEQIGYMGVEGIMRNKNGNLFLIGIGVNEMQKPMLSTGVYWKFLEKE